MEEYKIYSKTQGECVLEALNNKLYESNRTRERKQEINENPLYKYYSDDITVNKEYNEFKVQVKEDLLAECMYKVLIPALQEVAGTRKYQISKGLVRDFIKEEGVDNLLRNFRKGSPVLYEMYDLTETHYQSVMEKVDKKDSNTFMIDTEDKDSFFDDLDASNLDGVSTVLKERISSSIDDFVMDNVQTKADVNEIIQSTQERISATKNESVIEELNRTANDRIATLNERRTKRVLEGMIYNVAESSMTNDSMKQIYCENGKINMDRVVDDTVVIYSFLEMVNMCKMRRIDDDYIINAVNNLK